MQTTMPRKVSSETDCFLSTKTETYSTTYSLRVQECYLYILDHLQHNCMIDATCRVHASVCYGNKEKNMRSDCSFSKKQPHNLCDSSFFVAKQIYNSSSPNSDNKRLLKSEAYRSAKLCLDIAALYGLTMLI